MQNNDTLENKTPLQINPDRLYTTPVVADMLGLHPDTVYRIPPSQLRRTKVGPRGGRTKIMGRDLMEYLNGRAA